MNEMSYEERRARIEALLEHWQFYFEPGGSYGGGTGDGVGPTLSSMASSPPVVELVRCMELCRRMAPNHYKHLVGYYGSEWRTVDTVVKVKSAQRKMVEKQTRVRQRVVPSWVLWRLVDRGVDFLLGTWSQSVKLELPLALYNAQRARLREFVDPVTGEHGYMTAA